MELKITDFVKNADKSRYYGSVATHGAKVCESTFNAAIGASSTWNILDTSEKITVAKNYFLSFGAWEKEEVDAWSDLETNALLLQVICAELQEDSDNVFMGDDGEYYIYIGP